MIAHGEWRFEFGYTATERWLGGPADRRPTAIVAVSDIMAIGAVQAGQKHGLTIGRDLAVIGFDDVPLAQYLWPPLSSVRPPIREAGRQCVELLTKTIAGTPLAERHVWLTPELILRASA